MWLGEGCYLSKPAATVASPGEEAPGEEAPGEGAPGDWAKPQTQGSNWTSTSGCKSWAGLELELSTKLYTTSTLSVLKRKHECVDVWKYTQILSVSLLLALQIQQTVSCPQDTHVAWTGGNIHTLAVFYQQETGGQVYSLSRVTIVTI